VSPFVPSKVPLYATINARQAAHYRSKYGQGNLQAMAEKLDLFKSSSGNPPFRGSLVVLIDHKCGSGGEFAPQLLREAANAILLGTPTMSAVRGAKDRNLSAGFSLQIPTLELVTAKGVCIEGNPVIPDIFLPTNEVATDHVVFAKACELLHTKQATPCP
jgi:C-terminal processing protease CtpA/Prc